MAGIWETLFGKGGAFGHGLLGKDFRNMLFGNKDKFKQIPTMTGGQMQGLEGILQQLQQMQGQGGAYSGAQNYLSQILSGDPNAMSEFEAPYRNEFEQKTVPMLAERFAGLSPMGGGMSSSGFGQAMGGAGAGLQAQLAGLHGALKQNAAGQSMGQFNQLANLGIGTRSFENTYQPGSTGLLGGAMQGLAGGGGQGGGMALMMKLLPLLMGL